MNDRDPLKDKKDGAPEQRPEYVVSEGHHRPPDGAKKPKEPKEQDYLEGMGGFRYQEVPKPRSFSDTPRYVRELFSGFFQRFFYIFRLVWQTGPWILFVLMLISLVSGILPVVSSLISKDVLNELQVVVSSVVTDRSFEAFKQTPILFLLIFTFVCRILTRLVARVETAVSRISGELVVKRVKIGIMEKAKEIDLASFDQPEFFEKLENANREAGNRPIIILTSTFSVVSTLISLVSYILVLSAELPFATVVIVLLSIPSAVVSFVYRRRNFKYMRFHSRERREMNYYSDIMVNKDLVKEVRMFDLGDFFIEKYRKVFDKYFKGLCRLILGEGGWSMVFSLVSAVVNCIFYVIIAMAVFEGRYMIGDFSLYTSSLVAIATHVTTLISTSASIYEGTLFIDNLIFFMSEERKVKAISPVPAEVKRGAHTIEFRDVSFSYPGSDRKVLKHVNLTFCPGETVVLVGLNGAGKTTLLKLLTRLYDPTEGQILLDGVDLKEYDPCELYHIFGIIFQDFGKYACTISENIMFGEISEGMNEEKIRQSAHSANADDYIERLPEGYETPLMRIFERSGLELSIGQWQKLAIARAFYSNSDILILDEPTASLDAIAEQEIYDQFDRLRHDKTTIFVSHRLSSATVASKIVVLEYGEVIEEGNHRELMEKKGRYYELFTTQAKHYIEDDQ